MTTPVDNGQRWPPRRAEDAMDPPALALAEGFAHQVGNWARERDVQPPVVAMLAEVARDLSLATSAGDACLVLEAARRDWRTSLLASGLIADAGAWRDRTGRAGDDASAPMVLDREGRLYLRRYFDYERRLAAALVARASQRTGQAGQRALAQLGRAAELSRQQRVAVALALENRLTLISGGPGTGKTTTVATLLACLLADDPGLRIALAAPTGKAAARMIEALSRRLPAIEAGIAARFPSDAHTLHRLIGLGAERAGEPRRPRYHREQPLPVDLLVVDEASMLDLALTCRLVDALPERARLVLLGDKDQLSAVEAGAVFGALCAQSSPSADRSARLASLTGVPIGERVTSDSSASLPDCVIELTESHRFDASSAIGRLATWVNRGDGARARHAFDEQPAMIPRTDGRRDPAGLHWVDDGDPVPRADTLGIIQAGYDDFVTMVADPSADAHAVLTVFDRFRVLCALRTGPRGVESINRRLSRALRARIAHRLDPGGQDPWYPGRAVMVVRNEPALGLFNGDVGVCLPDTDGRLLVHFPTSRGAVRQVAPVRLPEHQDAFAITVHKSQGSEFERVLLMMPERPSRVTTRELVYTALTRATRAITVVSADATFIAACGRRTDRSGGLDARLREAAHHQ